MNFSKEQMAFIERIRETNPPAITVLHPDWRGIRSSMQNHVKDVFLLEDNLTEEMVVLIAEVLAATNCKKILYGALPLTWAPLIVRISERFGDIEQYINWQGSFLQSNEDYNWESFKGALHLCKERYVRKICFGKKGMEEIVRTLDIPCEFVGNIVDKIPEQASTPLEGGPHVGIWAIAPIWRKNPYAMLAATKLILGSKVYVRGQDQRANEFSVLFGIDTVVADKPLPMEQMAEALRGMHLNLYVTLSECSPMTPLESLAEGVPCLLGPNSHMFEDNDSLFKQLVVPFPDRAAVIAEYANHALKYRSEIVAEYAKYAVGYNAEMKQAMRDFLDIA